MTLLALIVLAIAVLILVAIDVHFVIRKHRWEIEQLKERVLELEEEYEHSK